MIKRQINFTNNSITLIKTKSGKNRTVYFDDKLKILLQEYIDKGFYEKLFSPSLKSFNRAFIKAGVKKGKGQSSHILRHTFASHFIMNGGSILSLSKIMGHSSINVTMRYAHLSAEHNKDGIKFNPFSKL